MKKPTPLSLARISKGMTQTQLGEEAGRKAIDRIPVGKQHQFDVVW